MSDDSSFLKRQIRALFFAVVLFLAHNVCKAQTYHIEQLRGKWHATRQGVNIYFYFSGDSSYKAWNSNRSDTTIQLFKYLDSNYFHIIDKNHFYIIIPNYGTERIDFTKEKK